MLKDILNYGALVSKIDVLKSKHLSATDYEALCQKTTVTDFVAYLKNNTYYSQILQNVNERNAHRAIIEELVGEHFAYINKKIYMFLNAKDRKFFEYVFVKYEIEKIKSILRNLRSEETLPPVSPAFDFYRRHTTVDIEKLSQATNLKEFIENLKGSEYYNVLSKLLTNNEYLNTFNIEMTLDMYYFSFIWKSKEKHIKGKEKEILDASLGGEMDMLNLIWIYRCKKYYNVDFQIIYTYLIPHNYKLKSGLVKELVETANVEEFLAIAKTTVYGQLFDDLHDKFIEENYEWLIYNVNKQLYKKNPYSLAAAVSYSYLLEIEHENIVTILEGIRYGIDIEEFKKHLKYV